MPSIEPSSCPVCAPHLVALQRFLDTPSSMWSTEEVFEAVRMAVHDIHESRCGVPLERLLLPTMLRLLTRDDLDPVMQRNVGMWVQSLDRSLTHV
jgi:hypothetical protein